MDKREEQLKEAEITINALLSVALVFFAFTTYAFNMESYVDMTQPITSVGWFSFSLIAYGVLVFHILSKMVWKHPFWSKTKKTRKSRKKR